MLICNALISEMSKINVIYNDFIIEFRLLFNLKSVTLILTSHKIDITYFKDSFVKYFAFVKMENLANE